MKPAFNAGRVIIGRVGEGDCALLPRWYRRGRGSPHEQGRHSSEHDENLLSHQFLATHLGWPGSVKQGSITITWEPDRRLAQPSPTKSPATSPGNGLLLSRPVGRLADGSHLTCLDDKESGAP